MKTKSQEFLVTGARIVLFTIVLIVFVVFGSIALAQNKNNVQAKPSNVQAQFLNLQTRYIYTCSITDDDSVVTLKSFSAKICVDDLNMRSMHVGTNGKNVKCAIDTPIAYFSFTKVNDEPGKGRTHCIVAMQDSSKPFDQPVPKMIIPNPTPKADTKPAKTLYQ